MPTEKRKVKVTKLTKPIKPKKFYSTRQKIAVNKLSQIVASKKGSKNITIAKILEESGYSPSYARSPSKLLKSKNFQESLEQYIPDDLVMKTHGEAFKAKRIDRFVFPLSMDDEEIEGLITEWGFKLTRISLGNTCKRAYYSIPDHLIRLSAVKEAYKVKNMYPVEEKKDRDFDEELSVFFMGIRRILPK